MTEKKLKLLFDYQKFQKNEKLDTVLKRYDTARELSPEELDLVNAAGDGTDRKKKNVTDSQTGYDG